MATGDFVLNTSSMDESAKSCQELAEGMKALKDNLSSAETTLLFYWEGKGCDEFEKQFRLLKEQLGDITDTLMETAEKILTAEERYILADTNAAKLEVGISKGEISNADSYIADALE